MFRKKENPTASSGLAVKHDQVKFNMQNKNFFLLLASNLPECVGIELKKTSRKLYSLFHLRFLQTLAFEDEKAMWNWEMYSVNHFLSSAPGHDNRNAIYTVGYIIVACWHILLRKCFTRTGMRIVNYIFWSYLRWLARPESHFLGAGWLISVFCYELRLGKKHLIIRCYKTVARWFIPLWYLSR